MTSTHRGNTSRFTDNVKSFHRTPAGADALAGFFVAKARAEVTREHVDSYTVPLLVSMAIKDEDGNRVTRVCDLDFAADDDCDGFYAACDVANKAHGYDVKPGYCPALIAENAVTTAERKLLQVASDHFGFDFTKIYNLELRQRALDLFTTGVKP